MTGQIKTKRWNDPIESDDGLRILVCRYRPRGLRKDKEPWDVWYKDLGPSRALHADAYGKSNPPIEWADYRRRYLAEMDGSEIIGKIASFVRVGGVITLLCSSACRDPSCCHRTLLAELVRESAKGKGVPYWLAEANSPESDY